MFTLFAFLLGATSVNSLTCHCANNSTCYPNGFCASGCEIGWHGPGCQIGNLAFNKAARQSSDYSEGVDSLKIVYSANFAVDGKVSIDRPLKFCTHTEPNNPTWKNNSSSWWVVTLDTTHYFVVTNVTLINRNDTNRVRLANFVILYSNETEGNPDPSIGTWYEFARETGTVGYSRTYTCNNMVIARRVAVYLKASLKNEEAILTLCEVFIYGYELDKCQNGYTGPGCLLRSCDQCVSTYGECTGDFGSCRYDVCPENSLLPPMCWITVTNPSELNVSSTAACNSVLFTAVLTDSQPNIAASSLEFQVSRSSDGHMVDNARIPLLGNKFVYYNFSNAAADTSYSVTLQLVYCDTTNDINCFRLNGSNVLFIMTGRRDYFFTHNTSCVFVLARSTTPECELPSDIEISCKSAVGSGVIVNSTGSPVCGLDSERAYNCSVAAVVNANTYDRQSAYIVIAQLPSSTTAVNGTPVLAGSIGGSVAVIVIAVAIIVLVVYRRQKMDAQFHASIVVLAANENNREPAGILDVKRLAPSISTKPLIDDDEQAYGNLSGMKLPQFQLYVQDEALIARRFTELQANEVRPCTHGRTPENKGKNRFQNIVPYDLNRVRLDTATNDYINASYINGFSKPKEYIAAQGPSSKTMEDFWHMLWQENCSVIIMLTDFVEHAKKKCEKYFPFSNLHGLDFEVTVRSQTVCDTHTVTVLNVRHGAEVRLIHHFHFLAWPDQSVPNHNAEMLLFYSRIGLHLKRHPSKGPLVVHCSAGVGRTGAYIAFDYLQQHYQSESTVDVDSCVVKLRDQRMLMVQTKEQYIFLHRAVLYSLKTMRYIYDTALLPSLAGAGPSPSSNVSIDMAAEWQELQAIVPTFHEQSFAAALLTENKHKNRRSQILALEFKRPVLSRPDAGDQLYINAVYCNGCYSNRAFIATQVPLRQTVDDFWLMVYDCQPSCILLLHDLPASDDREDCSRYWPDSGHSITAGWLEVKHDLMSKEDSAISARMPGFQISLSPVSRRMTAGQIVSTKLFTTSLWDSKSSIELPTNPNDLVLVANALRTYLVDAPNKPIIVQCRDGATQTGLFLSAVNALHRLIETDQVSVFHTVDLLRASRPEFVTSEAQYRFIYQVLEMYRDTLNIYANT